MKPHLVRDIENPITKETRAVVRDPSDKINVKQADIDFIKHAMAEVVTNGTASKLFIGAPYQAAGKTGTAQVYSLQGANYKGHAIAEHLRDHALFIAFAPVENPKIALALIVENGGWGAESAGPIARKVLDYYLVGKNKPGAQQAAIAAAASATQDASAPVVDGAPAPEETAVQPVKIAAGFTALPIPGAASAAAAASAAQAASAAAAASAPAVGASGAAATAKGASASTSTSTATKNPALRKPGAPHKPRPASEPAPSAAAPSRDDGIEATSPRQPVAGGIDE